MSARRRLIGLVVVWYALGGLASTAVAAGWQTVWLNQGHVLLQTPAGWRLDLPLGGEEARLIGPPRVEVCVRIWTGAREVQPAQVAAEYERVLQALGPGERTGVESLISADLRPGLLLTGNWNTEEKSLPVTAFAAYATGVQRIVIALCCPPEQAALVRRRFFDQLARSLRLPHHPPVPLPAPEPRPAPEPLPAPMPPPAPEPTPAPEPMPEPAPTPEPIATPAPPREPEPLPATQPLPQPELLPPPALPVEAYLTAGGLEVPVPLGWQVAEEHDTIWVENPTLTAGYFLWPVRVLEPDLPAEDLAAAWGHRSDLELTFLSRRETNAGTLLAATMRRGERVRALLYFWREKESGLLLGLYALPKVWEDQAARLAHLLRQVEGGSWQRAEPEPDQTTYLWVDESRELNLRLPERAQATGGVHQYNRRWLIDLVTQSNDLELVWRQPYTPAFRELTPILQSMGESEGNKYREESEEDYLRILSRKDPTEFVRYLLQQPRESLRQAEVQRTESSDLVAEMLPGRDRQGAIVWVSGTREGQPRQRVYLCATAALPLQVGAFRWHAGFCYVDYPPAQAAQAGARLRRLVQSAQTAHPQSEVGVALFTLIEPLKRAAAAVSFPEADLAAWAPLLGTSYQAARRLELALWSVGGGLQAWQRQVNEGTVGLPELTGEWWESRD